MKKITLFLLLTFLMMKANCQEKKENPNDHLYRLHMGAEMDICKYELKPVDSFFGQSSSLIDDGFDVFRLHADFSFVKRFAAGFSFEHCGDLSTPSFDIETNYDQLLMNNLALTLKYKFIYRAKTQLYLEGLPVYSWLKIDGDNSGPAYEANGFGYQAAFGWNQFFGKHPGMSLRFSYSYIKFGTGAQVENVIPQGQTPVYTIESEKLDFTGFGAGLGILFRF